MDSEDEPLLPHVPPAAEETLRLIDAFFRIADPQLQTAVLVLAQEHAVGSPKFAEALAKLMSKH